MNPIRILTIDDSVVIRRLLADAVAADPELELVGSAPNGRIGLAKLAQLRPDVVTLDVEMPDMDGLETVAEIRKLDPRVPVFMFSSLTERGAVVTLDALARGATDYVAKPAGAKNLADAVAAVRSELIPKIKRLLRRAASSTTTTPLVRAKARTVFPAKVEVVVIGCSTGGPNALPVVLTALPKPAPVPVLIVQHMPPVFTRQLAANLMKTTGHPVEEAQNGVKVEAGRVWLAAGGYHMTVQRTAAGMFLRMNQDPPEHGCRPAVDPLFRSAAEAYAAGTLAAVLTGMGKDGTAGALAVHAANGRVVVQDEETSVVWGMPGNAVRAGVVDTALPLADIGGDLARRLRLGRTFSAKPETGV
jgi:two-component system chemotaxis response regulator CheB